MKSCTPDAGPLTTVARDVARLEDLDRVDAVVKEKHGHIDILFADAPSPSLCSDHKSEASALFCSGRPVNAEDERFFKRFL